MTSQEYLTRQINHVIWADEAGLAAAATVPADKYKADFGFSFGNVHALLVHMMWAQEGWLDRIAKNGDPVPADPASLPTLESIRRRWAIVHAGWRDFLVTQTETTLDAAITFLRRGQVFKSTPRIVIGHVFDHATHHRGQLNSLIKLAGGTPNDYGQMFWSRQTGETIAG